MESELLSRVQTGMSLGVHFIFPALTLGLALYLLVSQFLANKTGKPEWTEVSGQAAKFLGLVFAFGVATGVTLPIAFGTNWARFSAMAGPLFGTNLAIEAIVAFSMEAGFLGVVLFGRKRVGRKFYLFSTFMVFLGSHLSALIIVAANSWMQTPFQTVEALNQFVANGTVDPAVNGFAIDPSGGVVLVDYWKAFFNPSALPRFLHTVTAGWMAGAAFLLGTGAWYLLRGRRPEATRRYFALALAIALPAAVVQPLWGHNQIMKAIEWQGPKSPAMEGSFDTKRGATLFGLGWVDEGAGKTYGLGIPYALSFLESGTIDSESKGLRDFPRGEWPQVQTVFQSFHFMVLIGVGMLALLALAAVYQARKKLKERRWLLWLLVLATPLPVIAADLGWVTAEMGRQPWTIYKILRTSDAASGVPAPYVWVSLAILAAIYVLLLVLFARLLPRMVRGGFKGAGDGQ